MEHQWPQEEIQCNQTIIPQIYPKKMELSQMLKLILVSPIALKGVQQNLNESVSHFL